MWFTHVQCLVIFLADLKPFKLNCRLIWQKEASMNKYKKCKNTAKKDENEGLPFLDVFIQLKINIYLAY